MDPKIKVYILILLLLFIDVYPVEVKCSRIRMNPVNPPSEGIFEMDVRELVEINIKDYREYQPNPKHDQGKGKPPGGGGG
ncbi:putative Transmembrane protein [Quillaja saponaria]|uniref:Transmembrane protein n=1 Tax=Quillaja saponaria TaxID=32244 RepID=A0AAD7P7W4_QUISA|nr:putative Transmembrane protein [Quillaja saponaria]